MARDASNAGLSVKDVREGKIFYSFPNTPNAVPTPLPQISASGSGTATDYDDDEGSDDDNDDELPPGRRVRITPTSSRWQSVKRRAARRALGLVRTFREFMTVPLWAALASLVVACVPPLQHALDEHVPPVKGAIASLGNCSIPVTLVVLGAYFYAPPDPAAEAARRVRQRERALRSASRTSLLLESVRDMFSMKPVGQGGAGALGGQDAGDEARPGETRTVVVAILSRMVITPMVLLPLMVVSTKFDLQRVFDECVWSPLPLLRRSSVR